MLDGNGASEEEKEGGGRGKKRDRGNKNKVDDEDDSGTDNRIGSSKSASVPRGGVAARERELTLTLKRLGRRSKRRFDFFDQRRAREIPTMRLACSDHYGDMYTPYEDAITPSVIPYPLVDVMYITLDLIDPYFSPSHQSPSNSS